jgi:rod shape-determining protein MreD
MKNTAYLTLPVMLILLIWQGAILPQFIDLVPNLVLLAALSWTLLRGPEEGALWAFTGGFFLDLFTAGPIGATALAVIVPVLVVGLLQRSFPAGSFFFPLLYAALGTLIYLIIYLTVISLLGTTVSGQMLTALLPLLITNTLTMVPVHWMLTRLSRWVFPQPVEVQ